MKKKILVLLLIVATLMSMAVPFSALAAYCTCGTTSATHSATCAIELQKIADQKKVDATTDETAKNAAAAATASAQTTFNTADAAYNTAETTYQASKSLYDTACSTSDIDNKKAAYDTAVTDTKNKKAALDSLETNLATNCTCSPKITVVGGTHTDSNCPVYKAYDEWTNAGTAETAAKTAYDAAEAIVAPYRTTMNTDKADRDSKKAARDTAQATLNSLQLAELAAIKKYDQTRQDAINAQAAVDSAIAAYASKAFKYYYQKKDTTTWVGSDDLSVAMKMAEGGKLKLGEDTVVINATPGSFELILDGHNLTSLIADAGSVTINDYTGKIGAASGKSLHIVGGNFGSVTGTSLNTIEGGIFDTDVPSGSYDSTKYGVITTGGKYKVVSLDSPEYKGASTLACTINSVKVVDASNTTGISTTDASRSIIWQDVKNVLEAFVNDGTTLAVNGAVGELITTSAYSMNQASILNTLRSGSSSVDIVLRKEDLKMANAGFDYQHIKAKLTAGYSIAALYDISIICYFGNTPFMKLTRTSGDIDINLGIHSALRAAGRRYEVVGVHNDNYGSYYYNQDYFLAQNMNAGTTSYHTVNFKTNFFSTYALAAKGGNFNVPVTADNNNTALWITLLCASGLCGACVLYLRRRKAKEF